MCREHPAWFVAVGELFQSGRFSAREDEALKLPANHGVIVGGPFGELWQGSYACAHLNPG